jgi:predicted house-cleaning noncanonical NTP pyrophosphatase (MazG superfamily)
LLPVFQLSLRLLRDVVNPYGDKGLVKIASTAEEFVTAAEEYMQMDRTKWLPEVDDFLADKSWSATFMEMMKRINSTLATKKNRPAGKPVKQYTYDYLIVGAGFAGSVLAERLASVGNKKYLSSINEIILAETHMITTMKMAFWYTNMVRIFSIQTRRRI